MVRGQETAVLKRPASVALQSSKPKRQATSSGTLKRPASASLSSQPKRRAARPIAAKKPAASEPVFEPLKAGTSFTAGEVIFVDAPSLVVQATHSEEEHAEEQPLFCAACARPVGPLEAALALAAGKLKRHELIEFARSGDGDSEALLRFLDFASKTVALPQPDEAKAASTVGPACAVYVSQSGWPEGSKEEENGIVASLCFCSQQCRQIRLTPVSAAAEFACGWPAAWDAYVEEVSTDEEHAGVLLLAAEAVASAAWPACSVQSSESAMEALGPLLRLEKAATGVGNVPQATIKKAHKSLTTVASSYLTRASDNSMPPAAVKRELLQIIPLPLFTRLVQLLDEFCWSLSGDCLPSPLARYCEAMCKPGVPASAQADMLLAIGPALKDLCERQDKLDSDVESSASGVAGEVAAEAAESHHRGLQKLALPKVEAARSLKPVLLKNLLSEEEIAQLKAFSKSVALKEHSKHVARSAEQAASWRTRYLHAGGAVGQAMPALMQKLRKAALEADAANWQLIPSEVAEKLNIRCVEHHLVSSGGALPDPTHFDGGSVVTLDVMLASPGHDFEGGEFSTPEADGSTSSYGACFSQGDALIFASHKPHFVRPVSKGLRETLVMELWDGEERKCDHRCAQPDGDCPLEREEVVDKATPHSSPGVGGDSLQHALMVTARDAAAGFASTAFQGHAFYSRVACIQAQSVLTRNSSEEPLSPNVEINFEDVAPLATVRATRSIASGDLLISKPNEDEADCEEEEEGEEEEEECEEQEEEQ